MDTQTQIETVHQIIAYPMAFLLVPLALMTAESSKGHRYFGFLFVTIMTFLYVTGMYMSLTRHEWWTWEFYRNISFNFFGFSLLLYGYRAMHLYRHPKLRRPTRLDYALAVTLSITVFTVFCVAIFKNTPMRVYSILGIILLVYEWKELRQGFLPRSILYKRHFRYLLSSYFYVLTVASLVHLNDELPRNIKWLWPTAIGIVVIWLLSTDRPWVAQRRKVVLTIAIKTVLIVALTFGGYAMFELISGAEVIGDNKM